ncbi:MAG: endolytic transglycosylase MltG [Steroidobacteraceae bacterium]
MRKALYFALVLFILVAVALTFGALHVQRWVHEPLAGLQEPVAYELPKGTSMRALARDLAARGIVERPRAWEFWARYTGAASQLRAGEYALTPGLTPDQLLQLFTSGEVLLHSLTIIEGTNIRDVRAALARNTSLRSVTAQMTNEQLMAALGAANVHPEGQFFPDTYRFPRDTTDLDLLKIAHRRMQTELAARWSQRAPDLPLASSYEALILASIVEKETALERERPLIAGVFVQRLRRGMRLQTDPTVIYGLQEAYDGNIRRADLTRDTPYNTYTRAGLPPSPIAMVGAASLDAAVRPQATEALFFVATGEPDGSHYFSRTNDEHQAAVQRYLRKLRRR